MNNLDWLEKYHKRIGRFKPFSTILEARTAYEKVSLGTEQSFIVLAFWVKLSLEALKSAKSMKEVEIIYLNSPPKTVASVQSRKMWDAHALLATQSIKTIQDCQNLFPQVRRGSKACEEVLDRWHAFCISQIDKATSIEECVTISENYPGIRDWQYSSKGVEKVLFEKWDELCLKKLKKVRTHKGVSELYRLCRPRSEVREIVKARVNELYIGEKEFGENAVYLIDKVVLD